MWILLLEAGVALVLLLLIVWSTMSRKRENRPPVADASKAEDDKPGGQP